MNRSIVFGLLVVGLVIETVGRAGQPALAAPTVAYPLDRTAYFVGEKVPLAVVGAAEGKEIALELSGEDGPTPLFRGPSGPLLLDTARLAPGEYRLLVDGAEAGRLTLTSTLRRSAGSMQDECSPSEPRFDPQKRYTPAERAAVITRHGDEVVQTIRQSGLTGVVAMAQSDLGRAGYLDTLARAGAIALVNDDTRPTSFFPVGNLPEELDGMSQRMILTAQANGRYPNFAGFCFGWDTTGYAIGGRRGLMTYWGWGDKTQSLRNYLDRLDRHTEAEFTRRTGLAPVREAEYIAYLLSIGRPEFAPAIDLPTKLWMEEIAQHIKPMPPAERDQFQRRLDAWSAYLMGLYQEAYGTMAANLRAVDPELRNTASVQVDHTAVRFGQYFPSAYAPLDLQYQSTWNDQVGGPDYAYQWLLTAGLLQMHRGDRPTWLSNTFGAVHGRAAIPGKFLRVAAHGLAYGVSGIGFACEGFSNLLGGMNAQSNWANIRGKAGEMDVRAGREFLDRFASLALAAKGDFGAGILFSRSQYQRQHLVMGFGTAPYKALVALARLGYTPRFVTEEDLLANRAAGLKALVVVGQTFPLPDGVRTAIRGFQSSGGRVLFDGSTTIDLPGGEPLGVTFPLAIPGKPHSWTSPNLVDGDNDALRYAQWHQELAPPLARALGDTGRGVLASEKGAETLISLLQIDGGKDARYVVAVNDSHIQTQADWHQVRERLVPVGQTRTQATVYDCTDERPIGPLAPVDCDLTKTTARVFAVLPRAMKTIELKATQTIAAGQDLSLSVRFLDGAGQPLSAVVPFHIAVVRPDGKPFQEFFRATDVAGTFGMAVPLGVNLPGGGWSLVVRCQLDGQTVRLPITVAGGKPAGLAVALRDRVIVRGRPVLDQLLARGSRPVLPIFDGPTADHLLPIAEKVRTTLAARGVEVEVRRHPAIGAYWLSYDPTDSQKEENARVDRGELIGKIRRETVNGNDWYSALAGYRFGRPVILLDLAGQPGENPMAEALDGPKQPGRVGLLWPQAGEAFPGRGRGVVQGVAWAFGPRVPAMVLQAVDEAGLLAAAESLASLPADRITAGIEAAKASLWREFHVAGRSRVGPGTAAAAATALTGSGVQSGHAPQPFVLQFAGQEPLPADQVHRPARTPPPAVPIPGQFGPKQFTPFMRDGEQFIEAGTAQMLIPDLRFSEAIRLVADVRRPGKTPVTASGVFRYSDRKPCWQAQWEDVIELREKLLPRTRRPMEFEVRLGGKTIGRLVPVKTETREVALELASPSAALKPKTAMEEVVTELSGEVDLPSGRQEILLIHHNIVDGKLASVALGP